VFVENNKEMKMIMSSGRFAYAQGFKSDDAAYEAFCNMCNEGEMSPGEGKIESYAVRKEGKSVRRYAVTVAA
jgi:hypothetical protein